MPITDFTNVTTQQIVQDLRDLADFYEQHPEVQLPGQVYVSNLTTGTKESLATFARARGHVEKGIRYEDKSFAEFRLTWTSPSGLVTMIYSAPRKTVCEMVETTKTVVEWRCPILLSSDEQPVEEEAPGETDLID